MKSLATYWNDSATKSTVNLAILEKNSERQKSIERAIENFGIEILKQAIDKLAVSSFANGQNDRLWKADLAWMLKPENLQKIIDGKYDNKKAIESEFEKPKLSWEEIKLKRLGHTKESELATTWEFE